MKQRKITLWQKHLNFCQTLPSATMTSVKTFLPLQEECMLIPDKLPLIVVTKPGLNGIFATSGYNVGMGDLLIKILSNNSCFSGGTAYTVPPVILCLFDMIEYVIIIL